MPHSDPLLFLLLLASIQYSGSLKKIVSTPVGEIRGELATDGDYYMFLGIPFAKVDEHNPFGNAQPQPKFENIFEANDDSVFCPQINIYNGLIEGTIDCLTLNVYVPISANAQNKLPVMVFIPGGGFVRGIAGRYQYGPKYLVRHDVILVTLNHRLGPYGFFCLDIPEVSGNQGLKDQVIALKWVRDNIECFGGDPNQVTLFGFSSGAQSIELHLLYSDTNLFNQAIIQSGSAQAMTSKSDKFAPMKMSAQLGMATSSVTAALAFLATVDSSVLIKVGSEMKINFGPCIEKPFDGVNSFINESWINVRNPTVKHKNIMLGIDEFEKAYELKKLVDFSFDETVSNKFAFGEETLREASDLIKRFYLGDKNVSENIQISLIEFRTDFEVLHPMRRSLIKYLNFGPNDIYFYMFSYHGGRSNGQMKFRITVNGATHGDEIGYLFDPEFISWKPTPEDQLMIDRITTLWTNFAKYGNPTPELTDLLKVKWTPISRDHYYYLKMDSNLTMENSLFHKRMAFWDLFYKLNEKYQKGYV